jgi:hypothetical protein
MTKLVSIFITSLIAISTSFAQKPEPLVKNYHTSLPSCRIFDKYFVRYKIQDRTTNVSFYKAANQDASDKACNENKYGEELYKISSIGVLYFAPNDNLLFSAFSWKTTESHLSIYDITQKKIVFEQKVFSYDFQENSSVDLWIIDKKNVCTEKDKKKGGGMFHPFNVRKYILDTKTFKTKRTNIIKCKLRADIMS